MARCFDSRGGNRSAFSGVSPFCNEQLASFRKERCLLDVGSNSGDEGPSLTVLESVQCLECGAVYAKPADGGTVRENPGCPECGYVGWVVAVARPFSERLLLHRPGADHLPHPHG
jgi:hypothetical protein